MKRLRLSHYFKPLVQQSRSRLTSHSGVASYRIGSVPQRFRSRPPSAIAITTKISSGRGASATNTVIVSKCGKDQESSLCPSGTSRIAPAAATLTFDPITAFPPPIAARIGFPSIGWTQAPQAGPGVRILSPPAESRANFISPTGPRDLGQRQGRRGRSAHGRRGYL